MKIALHIVRVLGLGLGFGLGLLASTLHAQTPTDFDYDKSSPATLGGILKLDYQGAPASKPMAFLLSGNGGPTPLKLLFGGNDTRSIEVGVDLVPLWLILGTTATGNGGFNLGVPNITALNGLHVHLQLMTGGGSGPHLIDKLSNKIVIVAGTSGTANLLESKLGDGRNPVGPGRALMTTSPIGASGDVLLAGGGTGNILGAQGLKTSEIYDFRTMSSRPGPDMTVERALHTATVLQDGRVLIVGGVDGGSSTTSGNPLATCEIYDPAKNTFTATTSMSVARAGHGATLLNDGRVLVAAGTKELSDVAKAINGVLDSCEIYDPTTAKWTAAPPISQQVIAPALTTLSNGQVLRSGGARINKFLGIPTSVTSLSTCQLYTPSSTGGSWASTGSMKQDRAVHASNTIRLKDGRVLVTGGVEVSIPLLPPPTNFAGAKSTAKSEYYNPTTGTWVALPDLAESRFGHTANEMPNGMVMVAGGGKGAIDSAVSVTSIQEFDPTKNTYPRSIQLVTARGAHGSAVLPDGTLIVFGGISSASASATLRTLEIVHQ